MQTHVAETEGRLRKDVGEQAEDEKVKGEARWVEAEARHKMELEVVKEEAAKALAVAKGIHSIPFTITFTLLFVHTLICLPDQWQQERIELETQMQTLHKEHGDYLQNRFAAFEAESKLMVATEVCFTFFSLALVFVSLSLYPPSNLFIYN